MAIIGVCPHAACGKRYQAGDESAGKATACRHCGGALTVPVLLRSEEVRLVPIPPGGLIDADRVAVHPDVAAAPCLGLLTVAPDDVAPREEVVRIVPLAQVPPGALAAGEAVLDRLELSGDVRPAWRLQVGGVPHRAAALLRLQVTEEGAPDEIARKLGRAADLANRLIWIPRGATHESLWLEIAGNVYGIRELDPPAPAGGYAYEVTADTTLELFSPSHKSGVDIVVLADCSGSMMADDVTRTFEGARPHASGPVGQTRSDAMHEALKELLAIRLGSSGRISRIALVGFTTECEVRFPRGGGMKEIDADASESLVQEFKDAIARLRSQKSAATDIGKALDFAADLIQRYHREGNDRLIVLISDGANNPKKGDEQLGERIAAVEDPVSLMWRLHEDMKIRLHAIGISNEELFERWIADRPEYEQSRAVLLPNHDLLRRLVQVGGGDPARIGDSDVIKRDLRDLGAGVPRRVTLPPPRPVPGLQPHEAAILTAAPRASAVPVPGEDRDRAGREPRVRSLLESITACAKLAEEAGLEPPFAPAGEDAFYELNKRILTTADFAAFLGLLGHLVFGPAEERAGRGRRYPVAAVGRAFESPQAEAFRSLRDALDQGHFSVRGFISYAHKDEVLKVELRKHLRGLERQGLVSIWHDRKIEPGADWGREIDVNLESARIVLLLISNDFMNSDYCYGIEAGRALELSRDGLTHVVPIALRMVDWKGAPFSDLQAMPKDRVPVAESASPDRAFTEIAEGLRHLVERTKVPELAERRRARRPVSGIRAAREPSVDPCAVLRDLIARDQVELGNPGDWLALQLAVLDRLGSLVGLVRDALGDAGRAPEGTVVQSSGVRFLG